MKRTKKEFNEAVGVPEGIVDAGRQLYNDMKKNLIPELNPNQTEYELDFKPDEPYKIGDMEIDKVELKVQLHPVPNDDYGDSNMQVFKQQKLEDTGKTIVYMTVTPKGLIKLGIDKPVPEDWSVDGVINSFEKNKVQTVSSLSHELKHDYDEFKKSFNSPKQIANYRSNVHFMNFPVRALQRMFYDMYYLDDIENLVRPTELYAKLVEKGIKKSEFLDYFKKEYNHIFDAMKFSVDGLIKELLENLDEVEELLHNVDDLDVNIDDMDPLEKVLTLLRIAYISYGNYGGNNLRSQLMTNPMELLFGLSGNKEPYFQDYIKKTTKYSDNPIEFYKNIEKRLKRTGRDVIKKMSKVYSLLPD